MVENTGIVVQAYPPQENLLVAQTILSNRLTWENDAQKLQESVP